VTARALSTTHDRKITFTYCLREEFLSKLTAGVGGKDCGFGEF